METKELPIKEVKCTHAGQHGAYSDSTYEYEIYTTNGCEVPEEDLYPYLCNLMHKSKMQTLKEWRENYGDMGSYFSGYYTLTKTSYGYFFKFVSPYTD